VILVGHEFSKLSTDRFEVRRVVKTDHGEKEERIETTSLQDEICRLAPGIIVGSGQREDGAHSPVVGNVRV
jgi:hypothetical protein